MNINKMFINIWIPAVFVFIRSLSVLVSLVFRSDQKSKSYQRSSFCQKSTILSNKSFKPCIQSFFVFNISSSRFSLEEKISKIFVKLTHISYQTSRWEREKKFFDFWPRFMSRTNEMRSNLIVDMPNVIFFQVFRSCKRHQRTENDDYL